MCLNDLMLLIKNLLQHRNYLNDKDAQL